MNLKRLAVVVLAVGSALLAGCDKKVDVNFVNTSSQDLEVEWAEEGIVPIFLGTAPAGGKMKHTVKEDKDFLPTVYHWSAGDGTYSGKVVIKEDSPDKLWVDIVEQRIRDENVEIKETRHIDAESVPVYEGTIVE